MLNREPIKRARQFTILAFNLLCTITAITHTSWAHAECTKDWIPTSHPVPGLIAGVNAIISWDPDGTGPQIPLRITGHEYTTSNNPVWASDGDSAWPLGLDLIGDLKTFAKYDGQLIAGGAFSISGVWGPTVVEWDGASWQPILVSSTTPSMIYALFEFQGGIFAGGSNIGNASLTGLPMHGIGRWDGHSWQNLGLEAGSVVSEICSHQNNLLVYGTIKFGGQTFTFAQWDGSNWSPVNWSVTGGIWTMHEYRGDLLIGGSGIQVNGTSISNLIRFDGTTWTPFAPIPSNSIQCLFESHGLLYASRAFPANQLRDPNVYRWNGTAWNGLGTWRNRVLAALGIHQGSLYGGGEFYIEYYDNTRNVTRWNGDDWETPKYYDEAYRRLMSIDGNLLISYSSISATIPPRLYWWSQRNGLQALTTTGPSNSEHWDAISIGDELIATGRFPINGFNHNVAKWNGSFWEPLGQLSNFSHTRGKRILEFDGEIVAQGIFRSSNWTGDAHLIRWDGTNWNKMGNFDFLINDLIVHDGSLFACGEFIFVDGQEVDGLARWDGAVWQPVNNAEHIVIYPKMSMCTYAGDLYVSGAGPTVIKWNGTEWTTVGIVSGGITAMQEFEDTLIVAAHDGVTGSPIYRIAQWNGTEWSYLEGYTHGRISALGKHRGHLVVAFNSGNPRVYSNTYPAGMDVTSVALWGPIDRPTLIEEPASQLACIGGRAVFRVNCQDNDIVSYEWRRGGTPLVDGANISGVATPELVVEPLTETDAANDYECIVRNACTFRESNAAMLAIAPWPSGDVNSDGVVNGRDIKRFCDILTQRIFDCTADINSDGDVTIDGDLLPFAALLISTD
ncbi:MAG: hypothetical protein IPK83_06755 [Planctomycetes bacterium]|nr:hypothetical protein [Planctomycetota bacterium]